MALSENEINERIDEHQAKVLRDSTAASDRIAAEIDRIRKQINGILADNSEEDGKVAERKIRELLKELDGLEDELYDEIEAGIVREVEKSVESSTKFLVGLLVGAVGISAITGGKPKESSLSKQIANDVLNDTHGGIRLNRRIKAVTGLFRDAMQSEIRYGIRLGESATTIARRVKRAVDKLMWQVKRIVTTEIPKAFRVATAYIGNKLGVIKAIKIIDNRGRHRYHEHHECYRLAEQNPYGWGKGVYKTTDTYIYSPHPQCSAYYHYVLKDEFKGEGRR